MKSTKLKRFYVLFTLYASVISLVCIMCASKTDFSITAGGPSANTFYVNAPAYVAGGGTMSTSDGTITFDGNGGVKSLFTTSGISGEVLADLLNMVNNTSVWGTKTVSSSGATYLSAKDFGKYNQSSTTETDQNSQIVVKLFEDTSTTTNNVNLASNQYWQAVYRSMNASSDVLTLYMCRTYTTAQFNPSSTDGDYGYNGNYSISYLRDNTVLPLYETLKSTYSSLDAYVVAPNAIPGLWQSSAYQTSYNSNRALYTGGTLGTGLGASGYMDGSTVFGLENGLDGLSDAHSSWSNTTVESAYTDKLWVPSGFETLHTGYGQASTSTMQDTGRVYDEANDIVYLSNYSTYSATVSNASGDNRTGLWELNGFDRASNAWAWLRSGSSNSDSYAREVNSNGNYYSKRVDYNCGVRVALHLNLKSLASGTLALISVSANASDEGAESVSFPHGDTAPNKTYNYNQYLVKNNANSSNYGNKYNSTSITLTYDSSKSIKSLWLNGTSVPLSGTASTVSGVCTYSVGNETTNGTKKSVVITISNPATDVAVKYSVTEDTKEYQVDFKTTFSASAVLSQETGIIVYVMCKNSTGGYDEFYSIFVKRDEEESTFSLTLQGDREYIMMVTKPYVWQISLDGVANITRTTFTPSESNATRTIVVSGGDIPNDYVMV